MKMPTPAYAEQISQRRQRSARAFIVKVFQKLLPSGKPVMIPADLAAELRRCLLESNLYSWPERFKVEHVPGPIPRGYFPEGVGHSITIGGDAMMALCNVLGLPHLKLDWHGDCRDCVFGPDRGYSPPCAGCGTGHPCFIAKNHTKLKGKKP